MIVYKSLVRRVRRAILAGVVLFAATPAHAGLIGLFDPAFGPSIPNLGFRGMILFDVTTGCYALGTGFHATGGTCQITAQSAQINYYNATTNSANITTVNLGPAAFPATFVFGEYVDPLTGQITGVDTNISALFAVAVTDVNRAAPISYVGNMSLYFTSGFAPNATNHTDAAYLINCGPVGTAGCTQTASNTSNPALVRFAAIPEPASYSLGLLGLGLLAAARRRARRLPGDRSAIR